jgi:tetratricopeptide (TPR) repeat protein
LVSFIAALPLAGLVADWLQPRLGRVALIMLSLFAAAASGILLQSPGPVAAIVVRPWSALGLAIAAVLAVVGFAPGEPRRMPLSIASFVLAALAWAALPWLYLQDRTNGALSRLSQLLAETRVGEADALARQLLLVAPQATVHGMPLQRAAIEIRRTADELRARIVQPLPPTATGDDRLARAQDLAMLGRAPEALALLDNANSVAGLQLRGIILKTTGRYGSALEALERAHSTLRAQPPSAERQAMLIHVTREIAACERKLGNYAAAERTYRELAKLAPTAETHFLLAQFYDDAQQAEAAQHHARRAMELDPATYEQPGRQLIDRLITHHFGCWGVFAREPAPRPTAP